MLHIVVIIDGIINLVMGKGVSTMKQVVHIIRKADVEKEYVKVLHLELDYELAALFDAIQQTDEKQVVKSKNRLREIHRELETLNGFA